MIVIAEDLRAQLAGLPDPETSPGTGRNMLITKWSDPDRLQKVVMIQVRRERFRDADGALRWVWTLELPG